MKLTQLILLGLVSQESTTANAVQVSNTGIFDRAVFAISNTDQYEAQKKVKL